MKYSEIRYNGATARLAQFGEETGAVRDGLSHIRREAHAIITFTGDGSDVDIQLKTLAATAEHIGEESGMTPVFERYMLSDPSNQAVLLPPADQCARSVIGQSPLDGTKGVLLVIYQEDATFQENGEGVWSDSRGRIWVGDDTDAEPGDPHGMTKRYLDRLSRYLKDAGGSLADNCLRTWFFVRDIDNNYRGVVTGRNEVFAGEGLTPVTHFIASTGIAGTLPSPPSLVAFNAYADLSVRQEQIKYLYGKTHLNPTYEYGVAFERGTAVDYGDRRHVFISGTASIDTRGEIVAPGDVRAQTERMIENIEVLLREGGCSWEDVAHMIVYLRDIADFRIVREIMESRFPDIPKAFTLAPVCRPGWLVETECMAVKGLENSRYAPF